MQEGSHTHGGNDDGKQILPSLCGPRWLDTHTLSEVDKILVCFAGRRLKVGAA